MASEKRWRSVHPPDIALALLRPGRIIAIDKVFLFASMVDSNLPDAGLRSRMIDTDIDALRKLNEKIRVDPRTDQTTLPLADSLTLVRKL